MGLNNKIAIVTGAGQGIGREIALRLAKDCAKVVAADINSQGLEETNTLAKKEHGATLSTLIVDIRSEKSIVDMVTKSLSINGCIDILVNNSGITGPMKSIEAISIEEWDETFAVNLRGMFLCCKHVIGTMKKQMNGAIVNMASITGKCPLPQRTPYAASKIGVIGLTRTLAAEVGKWNIRVNSVCPGSVEGPRQKLVYQGIMKYSGKSYDEILKEKLESTPLGKLISPKSVAAVVSFLCSEDASMMTGQDINVSGGRIMY